MSSRIDIYSRMIKDIKKITSEEYHRLIELLDSDDEQNWDVASAILDAREKEKDEDSNT